MAGAFREPRDIPGTVVEASSAAADVSCLLDDFSKRTAGEKEGLEEEVPEDEVPRIGVFICDWKGMLAEGLDLEKIVDAVKQEDNVACVRQVDVTSLKRGVEEIEKAIKENELNRVVFAGYRGRALGVAMKKRPGVLGAHTGVFEYANIGEQCVNVHWEDGELVADKARSLIRASLRKARSALRRKRGRKKVASRGLVVGGGRAGLSSSLNLAGQGIEVYS